MELVAQLHQSSLDNVDQVQKKQHKTYVARGGWLLFVGFKVGDSGVKMKKWEKMKKLGKKKSLLANWEVFVGYQDEKGNRDQDEGGQIYMHSQR